MVYANAGCRTHVRIWDNLARKLAFGGRRRSQGGAENHLGIARAFLGNDEDWNRIDACNGVGVRSRYSFSLHLLRDVASGGSSGRRPHSKMPALRPTHHRAGAGRIGSVNSDFQTTRIDGGLATPPERKRIAADRDHELHQPA